MTAIRQAELIPESEVASKEFRQHFKKLLVTAHNDIEEGDRIHFMKLNNNNICAKAITQIAKTFFFAGFRRGILYQKGKQ